MALCVSRFNGDGATIAIAFTNYSSTNQLSFERAISVLGEQRYFAGDKYDFKLYPQQDDSYILVLHNNNSGQDFASAPIKLTDNEITVTEQPVPQGEAAPLKVVTQNRTAIQAMRVTLPSGNELTMSSLRQFSEQKPRYTFNSETER